MLSSIYLPHSVLERFWSRILKAGDDECWRWMAYKDPEGYGHFYLRGKLYCVHRLAYELLVGPIPDGKEIDHLCRNPSCVNPKHLEAVTHKENILRGNSFSARKAQQVICKRGHRFDMFNTYFAPDGHRECRICRRLLNICYEAIHPRNRKVKASLRSN